jgi:hypothetical protein
LRESPSVAHYERPDPVTRYVLNPIVAVRAKIGLSLAGSRVL